MRCLLSEQEWYWFRWACFRSWMATGAGRWSVVYCMWSAFFLREVMEPRLIGRKIGVSPIAVLVSLYAGIRLFGVWGSSRDPLGFVLIYETYHSLARMYDRQREQDRQE